MTQQQIEGARRHWQELVERTRRHAQLQEQQYPAAKRNFGEAVHAEDLEGASYVLHSSFDETRLNEILHIATSDLGPTEVELREAQDSVTRAVAERATALIAEAHPGAEVDVQYALWGVAGLRYYGQDREALYDAGIPSLDLLEQALSSLDGGEIAARSILDYRDAEREIEEQTAYYNSPEFEEELAQMEADDARALAREEAALDAAAAANEAYGISAHETALSTEDLPEPGTAPHPVVDPELRESRIAAETGTYERKLAAWQARRAAYEAQHGRSPEEWQSAYDSARAAVETAGTAQHEALENAGDSAERNLQAEYSTLAGEVSEARQDLDQAGIFRRPAARRAVAEAESKYEAAFGVQPGPALGSEPPSVLIAAALTNAYNSPSVQQHREAWLNAVDSAAELDASKPKMCTDADRPKPPVAGTPEQEAAKDRAFAGRVAQNQRANATPHTNAPSTGLSQAPEH